MTVASIPQIQLAANPFDRPQSETVRFTMYKRLVGLDPIRPLPRNYSLNPWNEKSMPVYSAVLRVSFIKSPEVEMYPALESTKGCRRFLDELTDMPGFLPDASWLVQWHDEPVAAIISNRSPGCVFGDIQVIAVVPRHRRIGLGTNLVRMALRDFHSRQLPHAILSVNRSNRRTIRFFRMQGFQVNGSGTYH